MLHRLSDSDQRDGSRPALAPAISGRCLVPTQCLMTICMVLHGLLHYTQTAAWMQAKRAELQPHSQPPAHRAAGHDPQPSAASSTVSGNDGVHPAPHPASTAAAHGPGPTMAPLSLQETAGTSQQDNSIHAAANQPQAQADNTEDLEEADCVICWEAPASVVLQPCGHMCACSGCIAMILGSPCPMCRREVTTSTSTCVYS